MMRTVAVLAITGAFVAGLAACGERPQVVNYKQGRYQGKPDTTPYSNQPFNGNEQQWDNAMRVRAMGQNEYKRIGN